MTEKLGLLTYQVALICGNCGYRRTIPLLVPKGTKVWPATNNEPCEKCGCTGTLELDK